MRHDSRTTIDNDAPSASSLAPSKWQKAGVALRAETAEDQPFCEALFIDMQKPVLELAGWAADRCAAYLKPQYAQRERDTRARYPRADYRIVCLDAERVGRLVVDRSRTAIRLLEIVIERGYRGRGIGRDCLRRLCAEADTRGCDAELLVAIDNPAVRLYLDFDFEAVDNDGMYFKMRRAARPLAARISRGMTT